MQKTFPFIILALAAVIVGLSIKRPLTTSFVPPDPTNNPAVGSPAATTTLATSSLNAPENAGTEITKPVVTFTGKGFTPKTLNIKQGETVRFVNQSNQGMWVASDPDPAHSNYPEFDQKSPVSHGGFYEFTFDQIGTWNYHDHLSPAITGTITVSE